MEDKELKFESLDDMLDFLAADEQEAIDGYDLVLSQVEDEHVKEELTKLKTEEQAHKDFLEKLKEDPTAVYVDPFADEETDQAETEEVSTEEVTEEETKESLKEYWWEDNDPMNQVGDEDEEEWDDLDWPEPTSEIEDFSKHEEELA